MELKQNIKVAVDIVLFGYRTNELFILLIKQKYGKYKNQWSLPGGFVKDNEGLLTAARRELKEETGVAIKELEQLFTFGDNINRDHRYRVISVAYFGAANPSKMNLKASTDAVDAQWFQIDNISELPYDHSDILDKAYNRLKSKLNYQPIGFELLEDSFPFSDLENLYMTILKKNIDRRNFRKKILSFGLLDETGEMTKRGSGRPAALYRFNQKKYRQALKEGFNFEIKFA